MQREPGWHFCPRRPTRKSKTVKVQVATLRLSVVSAASLLTRVRLLEHTGRTLAQLLCAIHALIALGYRIQDTEAYIQSALLTSPPQSPGADTPTTADFHAAPLNAGWDRKAQEQGITEYFQTRNRCKQP